MSLFSSRRILCGAVRQSFVVLCFSSLFLLARPTPLVAAEPVSEPPTASIAGIVIAGDPCGPESTVTMLVSVASNPSGLVPVAAYFRLYFPSDSIASVSITQGTGQLGEVFSDPLEVNTTDPSLPDRYIRVATAGNAGNANPNPGIATVTVQTTARPRPGYDLVLTAREPALASLVSATGSTIPTGFDNTRLTDLCPPLTITDTDRDGLADTREAELGTDPALKDTDSDGLEDGLEVAAGTDPLDPNSPAVRTDTDGDGIPDFFDSQPADPDADGDGYRDGYELALGSDPADRDSRPGLGDANNDGRAEFADAVILFNVFLGNLPAGDYANERYLDMNRDGVVDSVDGVILLNWYLGNIPYLPL